MPETVRQGRGPGARRLLFAGFLFCAAGHADADGPAASPSIPVFGAHVVDATLCVGEQEIVHPAEIVRERVILRDFRGAKAEDCAAATVSRDAVVVGEHLDFAEAGRVLALIERCSRNDTACAEMDAGDRDELIQFMGAGVVTGVYDSRDVSAPRMLSLCDGYRWDGSKDCRSIQFGIEDGRLVRWNRIVILE